MYPQILVGLAATLSQRLWKPISDGSVHLSESDCAWEHSWEPQSPKPAPLGCAAPLAPQDQCLVPVTSPLFLFDLIPPLTSMKVIHFSFSPVSSLLCVALLLPIVSALPADPEQTGRHGELPNIFSCKSSHKIITGFLCYIIVPICHFYTLVVSIPTDFLAAFVALVYLKSLLSAARASLARQFTDLIFSPVSFLFNGVLTYFMGFFVLRPLWAFSVGFGDFFYFCQVAIKNLCFQLTPQNLGEVNLILLGTLSKQSYSITSPPTPDKWH